MVGITQYITKAHIARATLEAIAFQAKEVCKKKKEREKKKTKKNRGQYKPGPL